MSIPHVTVHKMMTCQVSVTLVDSWNLPFVWDRKSEHEENISVNQICCYWLDEVLLICTCKCNSSQSMAHISYRWKIWCDRTISWLFALLS